MSSLKRTIQIKPPAYGSSMEYIYSKGHMCPRCHGYGRVSVADDIRTDAYTVCPICGGCGALDAEITINWKPQKVM